MAEEQKQIGKKLDLVNKNLMASRKKAKPGSGEKSKEVKEDRFDKKAKQSMVDTLMAIKGKLILNNGELKKIGAGLAKSLKAFGANLIKKPIDAAKGIFGAIGEFLKLGALLLGGLEFLKSWEKASLWFGANADIWDRISAGFAGILQALGFTDDVQGTAQDISDKIHWIVRNLKEGFGTIFDAIKGAVVAFKKDGFLAAAKSFGSDILESKAAMVLIGVLFGGKILGAITGILGALTTILPVLTTITFVVGKAIFGAVLALSSGLSAFLVAFAPVIAAVAAVVAIGAALIWVLKDLDSENSKLKAIWEVISNKVKEMYENVKDFFAPAIQGIKDAFAAAGEKLQEAWAAVKEIPTKIKTAITDAIDLGLATALGGLNIAIDFTQKIIDAVTNAVDTVISTGFDIAGDIAAKVRSTKDSIVNSVSRVFDDIKNTFRAVFDTIAELVKPSTLVRIATTDATVSDVFNNKLSNVKEGKSNASVLNTSQAPHGLSTRTKGNTSQGDGSSIKVGIGGNTHITNHKNHIAPAFTKVGISEALVGPGSGRGWKRR